MQEFMLFSLITAEIGGGFIHTFGNKCNTKNSTGHWLDFRIYGVVEQKLSLHQHLATLSKVKLIYWIRPQT